MVSKSLSIFFILILFERYHLLKWTYLSKAYKKGKTPTLQLTFSNGEDTKSCVFWNKPNKSARWIISARTGLSVLHASPCIYVKKLNQFEHSTMTWKVKFGFNTLFIKIFAHNWVQNMTKACAFYSTRSWTRTFVQTIIISSLNSILQINTQVIKKNKKWEIERIRILVFWHNSPANFRFYITSSRFLIWLRGFLYC